MKRFFLSIFIALTLLTGVTTLTVTRPEPAFAAGCDSNFFGLRPWYYGMCDGGGNIKAPDVDEEGTGLAQWIWKIVLNILIDISVLVGYIATAMVAWGGYLYMFSRGQVDRAEKGKKTLISAVVGLIISILASVIMNTISSVLLITNS